MECVLQSIAQNKTRDLSCQEELQNLYFAITHVGLQVTTVLLSSTIYAVTLPFVPLKAMFFYNKTANIQWQPRWIVYDATVVIYYSWPSIFVVIKGNE